MIKVLLVDDVKDLRTLFRRILDDDEEIEIVGEAADGIEAIDRAQELQPDVVVLDLAMPRLDGLRAIPRLRHVAPDTKILIMTAFSSRQLSERALRACASAILDKGASLKELMKAVHAVHESPPKTGCHEFTA